MRFEDRTHETGEEAGTACRKWRSRELLVEELPLCELHPELVGRAVGVVDALDDLRDGRLAQLLEVRAQLLALAGSLGRREVARERPARVARGEGRRRRERHQRAQALRLGADLLALLDALVDEEGQVDERAVGAAEDLEVAEEGVRAEEADGLLDYVLLGSCRGGGREGGEAGDGTESRRRNRALRSLSAQGLPHLRSVCGRTCDVEQGGQAAGLALDGKNGQTGRLLALHCEERRVVGRLQTEGERGMKKGVVIFNRSEDA